MNDLISRAEAIIAVEKSRQLNHHTDKKAISAHEHEHRHFMRILTELPSAQPQIIRCKDCNYACIDPERESDEIYCSENDFWKDDDFYCGYAERRTDE